MEKKDIYKLPSIVLFVLGLLDLLRGFMHTFLIHFAADFFAKLDFSYAGDNQLFLLGTFGMSNILTGILYLLVSKKAKQLSPYVLIIIPFSYAMGLIGLRVASVKGNAEFNGKYMMIVYLLVCVGVFVNFMVQKSKEKKAK